MVFPLLKLIGLLIRFTSRPVSRALTLVLKKRKLLEECFHSMGVRAHEFEAYLDYKAANPDKKIKRDMIPVTPIEHEDAFHKGVDYFVEIFIFYAIIGAWSIYELRKGLEGGRKQKE